MTEPMPDQQLAAITELAAQIIEVFGDDWPLHYDTDADEVSARFEDDSVPFVGAYVEVFRTSQWPSDQATSPLAEFLAESIKLVPALVAEIQRLREASRERT